LWIAAPIAILIGENWLERVLLWFALSALAILLQLKTQSKPAPTVPVQYFEDEEPPE
jgi:hypothetical protein